MKFNNICYLPSPFPDFCNARRAVSSQARCSRSRKRGAIIASRARTYREKQTEAAKYLEYYGVICGSLVTLASRPPAYMYTGVVCPREREREGERVAAQGSLCAGESSQFRRCDNSGCTPRARDS